MRFLTNDKAKLGLASVLIQVANFIVLLQAKMTISDAEFALVLTQLAIAGIIGATASMRFEILIFQELQRMCFAVVLTPIAAIFVVVSLIFAVCEFIFPFPAQHLSLTPLAIPMMVGLALGTVLTFVFVQAQQLSLLLATRATQAGALGLLVVLVASGSWLPTGQEILFFIGMSYALPSIFWIVYFLVRLAADSAASSFPLYKPEWVMLRRSLSLTFSTAVNSVYVNIPLLAAAATQNASYVADFGLILRSLTAPTTLIAQVNGRLFLKEAINWSILQGRRTAVLSRLIANTMIQCAGVYLIITPVLISLLYTYRVPLNLNHFEIAPYLILATLGQCVINPISQVRIALGDEKTFLIFDTLRLIVLTISLYMLSSFIPFELAFGTAALTLYGTYIAFIFFRVSKYAIRTESSNEPASSTNHNR